MSEVRNFQESFLARTRDLAAPLSPITVYANTALLGAEEALGDNYPVTREIVGQGAFAAIALAYVQEHPPCTPVLATYGRAFADWLAEQPAARRLTYIADVARCERLWLESLHAADGRALQPEDLRAIDSQELVKLRLWLHPATRFGWFNTPAIDIWQAHQLAEVDEISPEWRPVGALFTRPELAVEARPLDAASHRLLSGIRLGETLGDAAGAASLLYPGTDIGTCFAGLVGRGVFCALN